MLSRTIALAALALVVLWVSGCECSATGAECSPGNFNCECAERGRCLTGLMCIDGICSDPTGTFDAGGTTSMDGSTFADAGPGGPPDVGPNPDAFFADDPPPMMCLEDGTMGPPVDPPGGTPECPDDKNREGCRCDTLGEMAPCWPGRRVNRNRGICRDGVTTCDPFDEFTGRWGPCVGAILPAEGVELGPQACRCFSVGRWEIDNLSPCFIDYGAGRGVYAVSTYITGGGAASCPSLPSGSSPPPVPQAGTNWSTDRLTVDCEGRFNLCYTLRAGNADSPSPTDCVVTRVCTGDFWYSTRDVTQELPPLPAWTSPDSTCARAFRDTGGYGEMSVLGLSVECDPIDEAGSEYVFNRVNYCPIRCNADPTGPGCEGCMMGGSGSF